MGNLYLDTLFMTSSNLRYIEINRQENVMEKIVYIVIDYVDLKTVPGSLIYGILH